MNSVFGFLTVTLIFIFAMGVVSVSYTHLDVYKRQVEGRETALALSLIHIHTN